MWNPGSQTAQPSKLYLGHLNSLRDRSPLRVMLRTTAGHHSGPVSCPKRPSGCYGSPGRLDAEVTGRRLHTDRMNSPRLLHGALSRYPRLAHPFSEVLSVFLPAIGIVVEQESDDAALGDCQCPTRSTGQSGNRLIRPTLCFVETPHMGEGGRSYEESIDKDLGC